MTSPTDLYRYYDVTDRLLYVGIARNAVARACQHQGSSHWYFSAVRITLERFPTRWMAECAEKEVILTEEPLHNVIHNDRGFTNEEFEALLAREENTNQFRPSRERLTNLFVIKPSEKPRAIPDAGCCGLLLIVHPTGKKTWAMRFRRPGGKLAKLTLGRFCSFKSKTAQEPVIGQLLTLSAARRLATTVNHQRSMGVDVIANYLTAKKAVRAGLR